MLWWRFYPILCFALLLTFSSCQNEETKDENAIREEARSYEDAYNQGDLESFKDLWAEDATYIYPDSGEVVEGREAILEQFATKFHNNDKSLIEIEIDTITFPKNNQAIETGTAKLKKGGELLKQTTYKATYEKKDDQWLITEVREVESIDPPSQYENLKELEWLIGEWIDEDEDIKIESESKWDKYKNFITQHFTVNVEGKLELEGRQVIAWDPRKEQIRSWIFDSDGGFGEGIWRKKGKNWIVEASHTAPDGRRSSAVNIYTPLNQNSYSWESTGREIGGELLPNVDPVKVVRKKK